MQYGGWGWLDTGTWKWNHLIKDLYPVPFNSPHPVEEVEGFLFTNSFEYKRRKMKKNGYKSGRGEEEGASFQGKVDR